MISKLRSVTLHSLPEKLNASACRQFLQAIRQHVEGERPRLVLDCSNVLQWNDNVLHLLLCCLEEAMKSNGDVKLAALNAKAELALHASGAGRLFEVHATPAAAISSYHQYLGFDTAPAPMARAFVQRGSESAA